MNLSHFSEKELVDVYRSGNEQAIQELIMRHKERVYTHILYKVKNEALAEDIFQDTFIKVINTIKKGKYNDEGKFLPWVIRIAQNLIIDYYRKNNRMPMVKGNDNFDIFDLIGSSEKNAHQQIEQSQLQHEVKEMIRQLPSDQKEVLMMRIYYNMSFKEISKVTNVSINTALGRMRYALINLKKMSGKRTLA